MMMRRMACTLTVLLLVGWATAATAQTQTGTVVGKIADQQGGVLPGVTVTLTGPRGTTSVVSDAEGNFRFVGIQPATYKLKAEIAGFLPQEQDVIVGMGKTATVDFGLKVGGLTETVEVLGTSSTVDVRSSATTTNVSGELLTSMAIYDSTSTGLMNNAPGINSESAYGGQGTYGNALLLDGVDTRDPEGGSAWTFFNQDLIEEIQIGGLGAPAEYGGFSGGIVNTITKSGGNLYSGLFSIRYTNDRLAGNNVTKAILDKNPALGSADVTKKLMDYSVQLGGPIAKDKAFFFASVQRYSADTDPSGPLKKRTEISPRFNVKLTLQPTPNDTIIAGMQYDSYNIHGRVGWWSSSQAIDSATVTEDAPEWVYNLQYRKVFGGSALLEAKYTGYSGYYYLDPVDPAPPTYDLGSGEYGGGGGGLYYADRSRNQLNVSLTKYAEKFGHHAFKFGAEYERSHVRSYYQPYGPTGVYTALYYGVPYAQYGYSYDLRGDNRRTSAYAQDQWSIGRLTLNLGLRLDHIRGVSAIAPHNTVYAPKAAWGPRLGAAYDVTNKGTTVLKTFWGRYFEGASSAFYYHAAPPGVADYTGAFYDSEGVLGPQEVITPGFIYGISKDTNHPRTDEFNVSFEQQLTKTMRFTATGIYRKSGNFLNNVIPSARWSTTTLTNGLTGQPFTGYYWDNRSDSSTDWLITNIDGFGYKDPNGNTFATADAKRDYKAMMLVLSRSMRQRWGFQASYVLAKAVGNVDNSGFFNYVGGNSWAIPDLAINNYGELTNSRRHEIKAYVSYQVPKIDTLLGLSYLGDSGTPYTPYQQFTTDQLNVPGSSRRQIRLEPRGSERNDFYHNVNLHVEKSFRTMGHRFSGFIDIHNLFNRSGIDGVQTRYPSTSIGGNTVLYQAPTSVQGARQMQLGARWTF